MIKILFLINTLGGGGAEKVLVNLVNNMDFSKFDITVETMFDEGVNASLIDSRVHRISKNAPCPRGIAYFFRFLRSEWLYKYFIGDNHYDILVAYMHGAPVKVIAGCKDRNIKRFAWLHNGNPETGTFFNFWHKKSTAFKAYSDCNAVVGISKSVADAFTQYTGISDNIKIVHNTNDVEKIRKLSDAFDPYDNQRDVVNIVSVGRLSAEKSFDRLFCVCSQLKQDGFNIEVTIVGTGAEKEKLKKLVAENDAQNWFHFAGFQSNPYPYVAKADLFVCSSITEGLSTAVTEAIILGTPCVSTNVSGAKEILGENNEFGIVTKNDKSGLYEGIKEMLSNSNIRKHYITMAAMRSKYFDTAETVKQAENLFINS